MPFEKLIELVAALSEDETRLPIGVLADRWHEPSERISDAIEALRVLYGERTYIPIEIPPADVILQRQRYIASQIEGGCSCHPDGKHREA